MKLKKFNFKIVNSTNDSAIRIVKNTNNKSGIIIAEKQKKGRGQYGNKWKSFNGNLFVSIFFSIDTIKLSLNDLTKITETKFIIITHHALTMSKMDRLYGVTMPDKGVSQLVSVDLQKAEELVA